MSFFDDILKPKKLTDGDFSLMCYSGLIITTEKSGSGYKPVLAKEIGGKSQKFTFKKKNSDEWEISLAEDDGYCLDICGCSDADGTRLIAYPRNDTAAQRFKIEKDRDGYRLLTAASGYKKYLAVANDGKTLIQSSAMDDRALWAIG